MSKDVKFTIFIVVGILLLLILTGASTYTSEYYDSDDIPDNFEILSHEYVSVTNMHEYVVYDKFTKQEYLYLVNEKYHTDALLLPLLDSEDAPMFYKVDN